MRSLVGEVVGRVEVYTDITESRRLYTQLLNSEKLRAIGEMASGVAHDFNNVLASIVGQIELLHPDELPPATRQAITTIRQAALDGARMVRNLQGLARPRLETPSTTADLNETVQEAVEMARPRWAERGPARRPADRDRRRSCGDTARVAIDPAELREVLLNLLFNAADAMPDGGRIEITTRPGRKPKTTDVVSPRHRPGHARVGPRANFRALLLHERRQRQRSRPGRGLQHHHPPRRRRSTSNRRLAKARPSPSPCRTCPVAVAAPARARRACETPPVASRHPSRASRAAARRRREAAARAPASWSSTTSPAW